MGKLHQPFLFTLIISILAKNGSASSNPQVVNLLSLSDHCGSKRRQFECFSSPAFLLSFWSQLLRPRRPNRKLEIADELGCSPAFGYRLFDPLGLSTSDETKFVWYREAELKHGRIAMMATLGMVVPAFFSWNNLIPSSSLFLSSSKQLTFANVPHGINAILSVPLAGWMQMVGFVGLLETTVFIQRNIDDMPGDYGLGYFGVRDYGQNERSLLSELENGRLAMLAFVSQVFVELITGQSVGDSFKQWLLSLE